MAARPLVERDPNERLRALIEEIGGSNAGLARRVNMCGAAYGLDLRYDKTSVSRWLRGQRPRGRTPAIIAEVLGDKLGRPVSVADIGMVNNKRQQAFEVGLAFDPALPDALDQVCDLWHRDARRRNLPGCSTVTASALLGPGRDWLVAGPDPTVSHIGWQRIGMADVAMVRTVTRDLAALDHRFGSGHVRLIAVHYLNDVVSGLLKGSYREATGRQLFAAAARLTELVGYMAVDTERPALAQRYYTQALRLSLAAGDRGYGSYVLAAGMSHLAASLGHPREIAQLARVAQEGGRGHTTPTVEALLYSAEARGHAQAGDARACGRAAGKAAEAFGRSEPGNDPEWIAHFDQAYLADELTHCYISLGQPEFAVRQVEEALAGHPRNRVRRRAIDLFLLATARLHSGELREACRTATRAVELLVDLRSSIADGYLLDFRSSVSAFHREPAVRDFGEWLTEVGRSAPVRRT